MLLKFLVEWCTSHSSLKIGDNEGAEISVARGSRVSDRTEACTTPKRFCSGSKGFSCAGGRCQQLVFKFVHCADDVLCFISGDLAIAGVGDGARGDLRF